MADCRIIIALTCAGRPLLPPPRRPVSRPLCLLRGLSNQPSRCLRSQVHSVPDCLPSFTHRTPDTSTPVLSIRSCVLRVAMQPMLATQAHLSYRFPTRVRLSDSLVCSCIDMHRNPRIDTDIRCKMAISTTSCRAGTNCAGKHTNSNLASFEAYHGPH